MIDSKVLQQQILPEISEPNLDSTLNALKSDIFYNLHCHKVGIIQSFDVDKQTATIQLVDAWTRPTFSGNNSVPIAPLINCPVIILKQKGGGLTNPIRSGDECSVLFNDRNLDNWQVAGGLQIPATPRAHSITDAYAIVGLHSYANSIANYNNNATELDFISEAGVRQSIISLDDKIGIKNAAQDLKTLIDSFVNIIIGLQVLDPISGPLSITSATNTALTNLKTQFDALLK